MLVAKVSMAKKLTAKTPGTNKFVLYCAPSWWSLLQQQQETNTVQGGGHQAFNGTLAPTR